MTFRGGSLLWVIHNLNLTYLDVLKDQVMVVPCDYGCRTLENVTAATVLSSFCCSNLPLPSQYFDRHVQARRRRTIRHRKNAYSVSQYECMRPYRSFIGGSGIMPSLVNKMNYNTNRQTHHPRSSPPSRWLQSPLTKQCQPPSTPFPPLQSTFGIAIPGSHG